MCYVKYILFLGLAILATSDADEIPDEIKVCLKQHTIVEQAKQVEKCYNDTLLAIIAKDTPALTCNNFNDYNQTYRDFYEHVSYKCNNGTTANLTKQQTTFLKIVKFTMDNNKTMEYIEKRTLISCFNKVAEEIKNCNKDNSTELHGIGIVWTWLQRTILTFDAYACDSLKESSICTTEIINKTCGPELAEYTNSMYNITLKMCEIPVKPNSSPYFSPVSHLFFVITAFAVMYQ